MSQPEITPKTTMKWKFMPRVDIANQRFELETFSIVDGFPAQLTSEIFDCKDECVRRALIALGWTPPPEKPLTEPPCSQ